MKQTRLLSLLIILCILSAPIFAQMEDGIVSEKLVFQWKSEQVFNIPESVCYDAEKDVLYVANINGNPTDEDGNGYISRMSTDGEVIALKWATGLNAPKGMGVYKGILYVTDIDRVAAIDIEKGIIVKFWPVQDAIFLNDIAIDHKGTVYISDMLDTKIYRIINGTLKVWFDDPILTNPNGLWAAQKDLYVGCKKILKVNYRSKEWVIKGEETGSIDGLEATGDGGFLYSDWSGNVYYMDDTGKVEKLLATAEMNINAADIEYIPEMNLLLVPTFLDNRVAAYKFVK